MALMVFPKSVYADLIAELKKRSYTFHLLGEPYCGGKVTYLIHCADYLFKGAKIFTEVEESEGIKSTFMVRPDSNFFTQTIKQFLDLQRRGWQLGYEYSCLSRCDGDMELACTLFQGQVNYLRALGFKFCVCDAHGDYEYNGAIDNNQIYTKNPTLFAKNNLVNLIGDLAKGTTYLSDSGFQKITIPNHLTNRVVIEAHTDWYDA